MVNPKTLALGLFLLTCQGALFSQQLPLFTQYREYYGYINPAALTTDFLASSRYSFNAFGVSHREQWLSGKFSAVRTSVARGEFFFETGSSVSFVAGGYFMSDKVGSTNQVGFLGRGAVYLGDPAHNFFGLGFTAGAVQYSIKIDRRKFRVNNAGDPLVNDLTSDAKPDLGVGLFGVMELGKDINVYGGVSMPQLFGLAFDLSPPGQEGLFTYEKTLHLYNYAGVYINTSFGNQDYSFIEISTWGKYIPGLSYHADFNFRYQISTPFWVGAGIATTGTAHLETGFNIGISGRDGYMKLGFGYDVPFSNDIHSYIGSSFEVNLSFIFEKS